MYTYKEPHLAKKKYIFFEVYSMVKHRINFIIITVDIIIIILADPEFKINKK